MAFTQAYIQLCYSYRSIYRHKTRKTGDWYGNLTTQELKVNSPDSQTDFNDPRWFYIPDLDDLFEFLNIQIKGCQVKDLPAKSIELTFSPATNWQLKLELENGFIFLSVGGKSPHEVLLQAIFQMSPYVAKSTDPAEKAKELFMKQKYRELVWRDRFFDNDKVTAPKPTTERLGVFKELLEAWREVRRLKSTRRGTPRN